VQPKVFVFGVKSEMSMPNKSHHEIMPLGSVPASAYRTLEETLELLYSFNVAQVKMVYLRADGSYLESVLEVHDLTPSLFQGFQVDDQWIFPDAEKAFFNPFFKNGAVLSIPCLRQDQIPSFHLEQRKKQVDLEATEAASSAHMDDSHLIDEAEVAAIAEMMAMNSQASANAESSSHNERKRSLSHHQSPTEGEQYPDPQPARKVPKKGTSCHQCKNTKHLQQLAFCTNAVEKRGKFEKRARNCRKKFCRICLGKLTSLESFCS
jgi:hypothetical protein